MEVLGPGTSGDEDVAHVLPGADFVTLLQDSTSGVTNHRNQHLVVI